MQTIEIPRVVYEDRTLTSVERDLVIYLHLEGASDWIERSLIEIAYARDLSLSSVRSALRGLVDRGFIKVVAGGGCRKKTRIKLDGDIGSDKM
jgi:DNA-binding MarR family transcriptional regulator